MLADLQRAIVLVLGDLGRSPRMLNHAQSLAAHGWAVDLVGYCRGGAASSDPRLQHRIRVHVLADTARRTGPPVLSPRATRCGRALGLPLAGALAACSCRWDGPTVILVQNPPGIPTLPLAWLACRLRSAALVVDWHNLTSAMLALRLGPAHALVTLRGGVERAIGRRADRNLFVSQTMADRLREQWGLTGVVFRDRPGTAFRPLDATARATTRAGILARVRLEGDDVTG